MATLLTKIQRWREDDSQGYDSAIELLCDAEEELIRLQSAIRAVLFELPDHEVITALGPVYLTKSIKDVVVDKFAALLPAPPKED